METSSRLSSFSRFGNLETMSNISGLGSGLGAFGSIFNKKGRGSSNPKTGLISNTFASTTKGSEKQIDNFRNNSQKQLEIAKKDELKRGLVQSVFDN